jgi:hypothetical protein
MTEWLLFIYKVPNEPSAKRVYVWRKLKVLGAILLQDSAWVLPFTPKNQERLQWLTTEILEMDGGYASLWQSQNTLMQQNEMLKQQFENQVDTLYQEILLQLQDDHADVVALAKQYQHAQTQDYFHSTLGEEVKAFLIKRRGE